MQPFISENFGNPSSAHWYGMQAKMAVGKAREQVAALIECDPDEIIFTSGGPNLIILQSRELLLPINQKEIIS